MALPGPDFDGTDPAKAFAAPSAGITVSFGGTAITKVTDLSWKLRGTSCKGRSATWTDDAGSVSVSFMGTGPGPADWMTLGALSITGGGMDLSRQAICGEVSAKASLNGITTYSIEFKIHA